MHATILHEKSKQGFKPTYVCVLCDLSGLSPITWQPDHGYKAMVSPDRVLRGMGTRGPAAYWLVKARGSPIGQWIGLSGGGKEVKSAADPGGNQPFHEARWCRRYWNLTGPVLRNKWCQKYCTSGGGVSWKRWGESKTHTRCQSLLSVLDLLLIYSHFHGVLHTVFLPMTSNDWGKPWKVSWGGGVWSRKTGW